MSFIQFGGTGLEPAYQMMSFLPVLQPASPMMSVIPVDRPLSYLQVETITPSQAEAVLAESRATIRNLAYSDELEI